ncbi:MAG: GNAT family N-acetyltransferase [Gemmatimonadetes bacterium]|uniref:GNAT family N-acetyltransferase n=1 Tax=Candidatus Kutchimonas denitrificans TaxID=3056748 RepID=A0AAE4ZCC0_9BACT|nr:GNAT family N-acetyltransferase [Gemmatimonadota bacterium]NIR75025.1 GNAT family N-acetyltransferase [Candidatus Kutchimonas denitrificans]NIS01608.1 GNAT family N-acetyltransferase [Gemmatimonadota bacterium]NIT67346.1 GNAT family N-acetyltransferase [Gemmatimonadota bacterium]NIU52709.1 GNAT family N-acetyltransferase [Gemmatimonadota bacterium]
MGEATAEVGGVRRARAAEAAELSELALRSKAHWGYDAEFLEACRPELTLTPELIEQQDVYVLENGGRIVGFYSLVPWKSEIELCHFFVDPPAIGRGVGRQLWDDAVERARARGHRRFLIQSDPNAEGFYRKLGAERIGLVPSQARPGRDLPLLVYAIDSGE